MLIFSVVICLLLGIAVNAVAVNVLNYLIRDFIKSLSIRKSILKIMVFVPFLVFILVILLTVFVDIPKSIIELINDINNIED